METPYHLKLNSRLLPALVGLLLVVQVIAPYDGWLILLVGLAGAWLAAYAWAQALARGLSIRRERRFGWTQVGDRLEERFTLANRSSLPGLWVEVDAEATLPDYQVSRASAVDGQAQVQWRTQGICTRRGLFTLGPTTLRSGDPLGIYTLEISSPQTTQLMVTPPIVPLPEIEVAAGGYAGEGRPRPDALERTASAASVRQYLPGDSLRWIHWRTTARRGSPYVRLFEGAPAGDWWIILDLDGGAQAGHDQESTEEYGVVLAASLADRGLSQGRGVGLAVNSEDMAWLPPREGEGQRWEILRALALVAPGKRPLAELLARMRPLFGRYASLIVITPAVEGAWIQELLPLVWLGASPTVLLLDRDTFSGPEAARSGNPAAGVLGELGLQHYTIPCGLLDRPEARPGQKGQWDWRISPQGRAVAVRRPDDMGWKALS